ncbi:MAG: rane protein [Ilumatobacteraceae bacterium]|nr:rane protein [Ilumatobacteraceae bacterium]
MPSADVDAARTTGRGLVTACHVQPTLAVTGFTTALAVSAGRGRRSVAIGAAVLCGQLAVGWSNDFLDRHRDATAGRLDKPIVAGLVSPEAVRDSALVAGVVCVPLSLICGHRAGSIHLVAVGAGIAYNVVLKRTPLSFVPYVVAFGALPCFVAASSPSGRLPRPWAIVAAALLGGAAHFINVLPDTDADRLTGVNGLPQRQGPIRSLAIGVSLLGASTLTVACFGDRPTTKAQRLLVAASGASIAMAGRAARRGRPRAAWSMSLVSAAATVGLGIAKGPSRWMR